MSITTASERATLRLRPHSTKLWMSIYKPSTILACQVNSASITVSEVTIPYDNVTAGSYSNIKDGMTLMVGSAPGKSDLGRVRVRNASSAVIWVGRNSNINWSDNLYLTVIDFFEVWPIFQRIEIVNDSIVVLVLRDAVIDDLGALEDRPHFKEVDHGQIQIV